MKSRTYKVAGVTVLALNEEQSMVAYEGYGACCQQDLTSKGRETNSQLEGNYPHYKFGSPWDIMVWTHWWMELKSKFWQECQTHISKPTRGFSKKRNALQGFR